MGRSFTAALPKFVVCIIAHMNQLYSHFEREELGGGVFRDTINLRPIAYLNNGVYRPITSRLGNSGDADLSVGVDELVQFRLRDRLSGNAPVVHFGKGNSQIRFTPLDTLNVLGHAIEENGFEYPEAWPNADLRFVIGGHRLQQDILLKSGHPQTFRFRIDSHVGFNPLTLSFGTDFRIVQPVLQDPKGTEDVPLTWLISQSGGKYILSVTLPNGDWNGWILQS